MVPDWLKPLPDEDSTNFVTFLSSDGGPAPSASWLLWIFSTGLKTSRSLRRTISWATCWARPTAAQFTDRTDTTIDSHPATVVSRRQPSVPLDGSVGCQGPASPL